MPEARAQSAAESAQSAYKSYSKKIGAKIPDTVVPPDPPATPKPKGFSILGMHFGGDNPPPAPASGPNPNDPLGLGI